MRKFLILTIFLAYLPQVHGQDKKNEVKKPWKTDAELGYVATGGNTETQSLNAKISYVMEQDKWRYSTSASALNASDDQGRTAERYVVNGKTDYKVSKQNYFFFALHYEKDLFSGFDYRLSETLGYGRRLVEEKNLTFDLELGPGARQSKEEITGERQDEVTGLIRGNLLWQISKNAKFTQMVSVESGEDTTITLSESAISAQIVGNLAMKFSYNIKNTSDVPPGIDKTDTETAITLVLSF